jgi:dolichol kinase
MNLKKRSDIHWARKIWHISGVVLIFLLFQILPTNFSKFLVVLGAILFVSMDILRKNNKNVNTFFIYYFKPIMRQHEINHLAGTTYLFLGVMILVLFFNPLVVSLSLLFLAFADPFASYFGIRFGRDKIYGDKTIQGFFAAFLICAGLTILYLIYHDLLLDRVILVAVLAGIIGALAELVPIAKLDDNLTIPIVSGLGLSGLFYLFGFL